MLAVYHAAALLAVCVTFTAQIQALSSFDKIKSTSAPCLASVSVNNPLARLASRKHVFNGVNRGLISSHDLAHVGLYQDRLSARPARALCSVFGAGTWISGLHTANKALMCWCSRSSARPNIVKVADVGFLGLLGSLSLSASQDSPTGLQNAHETILQVGLAHITMECIFNGIILPRIAANSEPSDDVEMSPAGLKRGKTKDIGLRPDIWAHHLFAIACFLVVLTTGEFSDDAVMLTAVECTCALPVAFGQAAEAKLLSGARSVGLAALMMGGFVFRAMLSAKLTVPRVITLGKALMGQETQLVGQSGQVYPGSITSCPRVVLIAGTAGLAVLNTLWLFKITVGTFRDNSPNRSDEKPSGSQ